MKYVVTDEDVERAWAAWNKHTAAGIRPDVRMRAALEDFAQTLGEPVAVPDGNDAVDSAIGWLVACASRSITFLMDEASKYEDDGSNEPLETARDIEKAIDDLAKVYGYSAPHHPTTEKGCE